MDTPTAVVTGAFSFTGSAVAQSLLARGFAVRTLTNRRTKINDLGARLEAFPLQFEDSARLVEVMRGAQLLVSTYWVRYPHVGVGFDRAVENTSVLLRAAREAGVARVTHVSVSNPSLDSPLSSYRAKAEVEALVRQLGVSYAMPGSVSQFAGTVVARQPRCESISGHALKPPAQFADHLTKKLEMIFALRSVPLWQKLRGIALQLSPYLPGPNF